VPRSRFHIAPRGALTLLSMLCLLSLASLPTTAQASFNSDAGDSGLGQLVLPTVVAGAAVVFGGAALGRAIRDEPYPDDWAGAQLVVGMGTGAIAAHELGNPRTRDLGLFYATVGGLQILHAALSLASDGGTRGQRSPRRWSQTGALQLDVTSSDRGGGGLQLRGRF